MQIAAGEHLHRLHGTGLISRYIGTPDGWAILDDNPATVNIAVAGDQLYQLHATGHIYRYTGTPITGWELLDSTAKTIKIVAAGQRLFQLRSPGQILSLDLSAPPSVVKGEGAPEVKLEVDATEFPSLVALYNTGALGPYLAKIGVNDEPGEQRQPLESGMTTEPDSSTDDDVLAAEDERPVLVDDLPARDER